MIVIIPFIVTVVYLLHNRASLPILLLYTLVILIVNKVIVMSIIALKLQLFFSFCDARVSILLICNMHNSK